MFSLTDRRYKNVQTQIADIFDTMDNLNTTVINLKKRVMALEGKYAVSVRDNKKGDATYKEVLERFLGGKVVGLLESDESGSGMESDTKGGDVSRV